MPRKSNTASILVSAAIFILLEVAAVAMLHSSSVLQNIWINRASHNVSSWIWGKGTRLNSYFHLASRNKALEEENMMYSRELRKYRALDEQYKYLENSYGYNDEFDYTFARIVKMGTNSQRNYIVVNKGYEDGVTTLSGIITSDGVVGVIDAVGAHHAYGRTLMNPSISVSVRLGRGGIAGPLVWNGRSSTGAIIQGIPLGYTAHPQDTVWTSGYSTLFPPEIPVGIVTGTTTRSGATQDIVVELLQDFSSIDYVTIVKNRNIAEIEMLEKSQEDKKK